MKELEKPKTCESYKYAEPVFSDTMVWCKSEESPIGNITGLALPKNYGCVHYEVKICNDKIF